MPRFCVLGAERRMPWPCPPVAPPHCAPALMWPRPLWPRPRCGPAPVAPPRCSPALVSSLRHPHLSVGCHMQLPRNERQASHLRRWRAWPKSSDDWGSGSGGGGVFEERLGGGWRGSACSRPECGAWSCSLPAGHILVLIGALPQGRPEEDCQMKHVGCPVKCEFPTTNHSLALMCHTNIKLGTHKH